jgi:hypothetical protein
MGAARRGVAALTFPWYDAIMRALKLGAVAAVLVLSVLALLWVTGAVPRADVASMAPKALAALAVLVAGGALLGALAGRNDAPDATDKRVP